MILATLGDRHGDARQGMNKKYPIMSHMNLNDSNLTYPSLAHFLASAQLRLSKQGHCKFIPKQLRFREWLPTDPAG